MAVVTVPAKLTFSRAFGPPDRVVSEQHPSAVPHEPSGGTRAHSRLRPLPGARGLVQQLQTSGLFRGNLL